MCLGVPDADVPQVKAWAGNRIKLYYGRPTAEEQIAMTEESSALLALCRRPGGRRKRVIRRTT